MDVLPVTLPSPSAICFLGVEPRMLSRVLSNSSFVKSRYKVIIRWWVAMKEYSKKSTNAHTHLWFENSDLVSEFPFHHRGREGCNDCRRWPRFDERLNCQSLGGRRLGRFDRYYLLGKGHRLWRDGLYKSINMSGMHSCMHVLGL